MTYGASTGVETAIKDDKQGFAAQQMLLLLGLLAPNVRVWARRWLAPHEPNVRRYGLQRLVRDMFPISGQIIQNARGRIGQIGLTHAAPRVRGLARSGAVLLRTARLAVPWGKPEVSPAPHAGA